MSSASDRSATLRDICGSAVMAIAVGGFPFATRRFLPDRLSSILYTHNSGNRMRRGAELVGDACLASGKSSPAAAYVEFSGNYRITSGHTNHFTLFIGHV